MKNSSVDTFELSSSAPRTLTIDNSVYTVFVDRKINIDIEAPRLVVVSYLPTLDTIDLLQSCIETIIKFTDTSYELWVVDNNSPIENLRWLQKYETINIVYNRTNPEGSGGSYANAIALEIGRRVVDVHSKYMMTLHQDTAVCCKGWLNYLLSKLNDSVRVAGVRKDSVRVERGILHVLGYLFDFQLFNSLNLNFFPELPDYDVGDKAIVEFQKAGYEIFSTPNSMWDDTVKEKLPLYPPYRELEVDRSITDDNQVIFLHLGRGVVKTSGSSTAFPQGKSIATWNHFVKKYLLENDATVTGGYKEFIARIQKVPSYSLRRFFVDRFFEQSCRYFPVKSRILDIGGKRKNKRGFFNIEDHGFIVEYVNINAETSPDYCCSANDIPVPDNRYDGVILAEVLEHLPDPVKALEESFRLLKPGGIVLMTTPFTFHIHGDPDDYARYTSSWFRAKMKEIGFQDLSIERQGLFFLVLADMLGLWFRQKYVSGGMLRKVQSAFIERGLKIFLSRAFLWDGHIKKNNSVLSGYTTGFGVIAKKGLHYAD